MLLLAACLAGVVAGSRSMLAPALTSWFAWMGLLPVARTPLAFMGSSIALVIFSVLAVGELVVDTLPRTPSRKALPGFATRIVSGALVGATVGAAGYLIIAGLLLGVCGAVIGTLGGAAARGALARSFGRDLPAALLEDAVAIMIGIFALLELA
ncbi:MAG TPA: DUF4126 domain-containing protein [Acidobacteriaceae bacterium]|jgi:uncharacterized membrane protein|nr:DUF4126 domain-containing protein [Acidobacteriaceae bacterium]